MANEEHVAILREGVDAWNEWRKVNKGVRPDLSEEDLTRTSEIKLAGAKLGGAILEGSNLSFSYLKETELPGANLDGCRMYNCYMTDADLAGATLVGAQLGRANMYRVNLTGADLRGAVLEGASLVDTKIEQARLSGAHVYGVAAWNLKGQPADQTDLVITRADEPVVTVDDLRVAQFIHLLLSNPSIGNVIDTITSKVVLILGRFTEERKVVLDALRDELRRHNLTPVLFDFDVPKDRNITETVTLLARMARFVIADLTDPRSIPQELQAIVPHLPSVPVQPIIVAGQDPWGMFPDLQDIRGCSRPTPMTVLSRSWRTLRPL